MRHTLREAKFRDWIAAHQGILVHVARGYAQGADRDDLVQEMLLAVWHALPVFREDASVATFLYRVAQNTALTWHRRRRQQPNTQPLADTTDIEATVSTKVERTERLYAAIRRLPDPQRALALLYLDELSYRQIADVLGISESNFGVRLHRIRKHLAQLLQEQHHDYHH